ncbi:MAG: host attachment protein [Hyphomicrobium sp.]
MHACERRSQADPYFVFHWLDARLHDPQSLGQIRPSLHKGVQDRLVAELGKTLTKASIADIKTTLH